jgi:hypothetical protein
MMTKANMGEWLTSIFSPNINNRSLLIVDSWSTYQDKEFIRQNLFVPEDAEVIIEQIPPHNTCRHQPLDVAFFRYYKSYIRRLYERICVETIGEFPIHQRDNVLKIQSIAHNQFSAPKFVNLIKYSWFKAGYIDERFNYITPLEYCFSNMSETCHLCEKFPFTKCAWCDHSFCLNHFFSLEDFDAYHACN